MFILTLTVRLQYFTQHGYHVIVLNFEAGRILVLSITCFITLQHCNENNNIDVLFIVCTANHYYVKISV